MMWYDLGGVASLVVGATVEPAVAAYVRRQMEPYRERANPPQTDVAIVRSQESDGQARFLDIENPAGDAMTTAWDGKRAFVIRGDCWCSVPDPLHERPAVFEYESGFPVGDVWGNLVRPAMSLATLQHGAVVVHSSAVEIDGRVVLIAGWSETGKTEVALALAECGAGFVSDKWSILRADGTVLPFPASVGVRRWVLPYLPTIRSHLRPASRAQLAGAAVAGALSYPLQARPNSRAVLREAANLSGQVTALADRVALSTTEVRRMYGNASEHVVPRPLAMLVLLSTVRTDGKASVQPIDPKVVAGRLARAAAFERRAYFSVGIRVGYSAGGLDRSDAQSVIDIETATLTRLLAGVPTLEARTAFPEDPRPLAAAVRKALCGR
jgi:hypothetical protein